MDFIGYLLFFLAGVGFGYAAPAKLKPLPLMFPIVLAIVAFLSDGIQGEIVVRLLIALAVTAIGIVLGGLIDARASRGEAAAQ
jgi:hypothetical protein